MDDDLSELYQSIILEHNRSPQNFRKMEDADRRGEGFNASCGDDIHVYLKVSDDQKTVVDVSFFGEGCAISKASASLLTLSTRGLSTDEATKRAEEIVAILTGKDERDALKRLGNCAPLLGVKQFPMRVKCATLPWHALLDALDS